MISLPPDKVDNRIRRSQVAAFSPFSEQTSKRELIDPNRDAHIRALDGLRGLAIILVMLSHFTYFDGMSPVVTVDRMVRTIAYVGWVGVDLFFVLSGFLITGILYDSKGGGHYFRNFFARRVLRIFPVYYLCLVIFLILLPRLFPDHLGLQALRKDGFWYWTYLANYPIARVGFPPFPVLGHFWSLAIEEQFYLVWPAVVLLSTRSDLIRICRLCIVGAFVVRVAFVLGGYGEAAYVLTPARMDSLAVGAFLALEARGQGGLKRIARLAWPTTIGIGAILVAVFLWRRGFAPWDPIVKTIGHTLLAFFFGAVLVLTLVSSPRTVIGRIFESSQLSFFGRYSYALYAYHAPILFFRMGRFLPLDSIPTVYGSLLLKKLVFVISATLVSVALALISWHLYEKQFLKLKRFFPYQSREESLGPARATPMPAFSPAPLATSE
jgi:peptidoglycan/LPS O-acetylase OafA/YrhL